jgi:prolipoprotein diacylglyceryltransferase
MTNFLKDVFLGLGVVWLLTAICILTFKLNIGEREILATLIFPIAYGIVRFISQKTADPQKN